MIAVEGLVKGFGLYPVLRGISFRVERGSITALLGPNGSGKTTLLRILAAMSRPTSGSVSIGGWQLPAEAARVRAQLGVVAHLPLLYDDLTAVENLTFFAQLYGIERPAERISTVLERVGLTKRFRDPVRTYSRGMQQRLAIARAMLHDPAVMLLDEPYTGLDVSGVTLLDGFLSEWKAAGHTVIMATHDLERVTSRADQILILKDGKLAVDRPTAGLADLSALFVDTLNR